jgi:hypothetical protein
MWETRDRPLLEAIAAADAEGRRVTYSTELVEATGLSPRDTQAGLQALYDAAMIDGADVGDQVGFDLMDIRLRERGRRASGQWPSHDPYEDFIGLIESRLTSETDPDARSELERLVSSLGGFSKDVIANLLATLIGRQAGLS